MGEGLVSIVLLFWVCFFVVVGFFGRWICVGVGGGGVIYIFLYIIYICLLRVKICISSSRSRFTHAQICCKQTVQK